MKKITALLCVALLFVVAAGGCAQKATYTDGVYFASGDIDAHSGYRPIVTVTVSGGKIIAVNWNELHYENADKKAQGDAYNMKSASGIGKEWYEQAKAVEDLIVAKGPDAVKYETEGEDAGKAKGISGATITVSGVMNVFQKAMAAAPVAKGSMKDGIYMKVSDQETDGYKDSVTLVVVNGTIVLANWDRIIVNAGEDDPATLQLKEASGAFATQAKAFNDAVIKAQGSVDTVAGDQDFTTAKTLLDELIGQAK